MAKQEASDNKTTLLIVEDDQFLRSLIVKKLETAGYEILQAIDGSKGLDLLEENKPDGILLDLVLPGMDGFEVLKKIKDNEDTKDIPVIILSNLGSKEDVDKGIRLGAAEYMIKANFSPDEVVEKIQKIIK